MKRRFGGRDARLLVPLISATIVLLASAVSAQTAVNPTLIQQKADIYIQNTDVYYTPYLPPGPGDSREQLSAIAEELRDLDGRPDHLYSWNYDPQTRGASFKATYGDTAVWMRLFQAMRKPDGSTSDIIAGSHVTTDTLATNGHYGPDTVSALEDVDFRASGTVKLKDGFHVRAGAFFHAYQEPNWGSGNCATAGDSGNALLFCDEFDAAKPQWPTMNGYWAGADCEKDSNVTSNYSDPDAIDGKALRIVMKVDSCMENTLDYLHYKTDTSCVVTTGCEFREVMDITSCTVLDNNRDTSDYSSGGLMSCPWPFKSVATQPDRPVSQNLPYGRYEIREKLPHGLFYHTDVYADDHRDAWNFGETYQTDTAHIVPCIAHLKQYGPFKGKFGMTTNDTVLRCGQARFSSTNSAILLIIDGFPYSGSVGVSPSGTDTFFVFDNNTKLKGGIPVALYNADSVTFYYERASSNSVPSLYWSVDSTRRYLTTGYGVDSHGDTLRFGKDYQPTSVTLFPISLFPITLGCHWDHSSGLVLLDTTLPAVYPTSDYGFNYTCEEISSYPQPAIFNHSGEYHTYTFEMLPNEWRFFVDGAYVRRVPDRLIPVGDKRHNFVRDFPRMLTPAQIHFDIDGRTRVGERAADASYLQRVLDFVSRYGSQADMKIDHIKIWGLPGQYKVTPFPY